MKAIVQAGYGAPERVLKLGYRMRSPTCWDITPEAKSSSPCSSGDGAQGVV